MKIFEKLNEHTKRQIKEKGYIAKPKETFSKEDLEDLMGCNRDTYHKVNGKIKRR